MTPVRTVPALVLWILIIPHGHVQQPQILNDNLTILKQVIITIISLFEFDGAYLESANLSSRK